MLATPRLTLDTNLLFEHWKQGRRRETVQKLLDLGAAGEVDLAVTRYIHADVPHEPLASEISKFRPLQVRMTGGVFQLDVSTLDGPDVLGSQEYLDAEWSIPSAWRPKKGSRPSTVDLMHVHAHFAQGRDVFLTWDEGLLEAASTFFTQLPLRVDRPEDFLERWRVGEAN